jgi:WD40 repeat protein
MLPPGRLKLLVAQAVRAQLQASASTDNDPDATVSLFSDCTGSMAGLPIECSQVLRQHEGQVWNARFSANGAMVATGSQDGHVLVWMVCAV